MLLFLINQLVLRCTTRETRRRNGPLPRGAVSHATYFSLISQFGREETLNKYKIAFGISLVCVI